MSRTEQMRAHFHLHQRPCGGPTHDEDLAGNGRFVLADLNSVAVQPQQTVGEDRPQIIVEDRIPPGGRGRSLPDQNDNLLGQAGTHGLGQQVGHGQVVQRRFDRRLRLVLANIADQLGEIIGEIGGGRHVPEEVGGPLRAFACV